MSSYFIALLVLVQSIIGVAIFTRNPRKRANQFYAAFVALLNIWIVSNFLQNEPEIVGWGWSQFFLKLDFTTAVLFFYFWFLFVSVLVGSRIEQHRYAWMKLALGILAFAISTLSFSGDLLIQNITFSEYIIRFTAGPLMGLYATILLSLMGLSTAYLVLGIRNTTRSGYAHRTHQLKLILVGSGLSLGIGLAINLLQTIRPDMSIEISRLGLYGMIFLVGFTGFAMGKANFFEVRLSLLKTVLSIFLVLLVAGGYTLAMFILFAEILHIDVRTVLATTVTLVGVIVATTFEQIRKYIERTTEKIFFKGQYDKERVIKKVTRVLIDEVEIAPLSEKIFEILKQDLHIDHSALLLIGEHNTYQWLALGFTQEPPNELTLRGIHEIITDVPCVYDELPLGELRDFFAQHYIAATFPVKLKEQTIAILVLGHKLSGEPLAEADIMFLELLASEMAIGIQNAKSFSEILHFNEKLEESVRIRTHELEVLQKEELLKAKEVSRLKDEFVFLASHELRTPITAIRGFLELTLDAKLDLPLEAQQNLEAISQASEHLNQLVNDLLEIARNEGGKLTIDTKEVNLKNELSVVLRELGPLIKEKSMHLHEEVRDIPTVLSDPTKLKEVVLNLVGNAIKYGKENGNIYVTVFRLPGEPFVLIEVRDDGYGIPKDQQEKIFQKFFRAGTRGTERVLGTGLGLFITRMLVERMGGKIMFTSSEQAGSTFSFTLPIAK